jgi:outer membrane lipoprotein-sorting protein
MLQSMRDIEKEAKSYSCAHARDETIEGVAATVYGEHAETADAKSDTQLWISKGQGLIIKWEMKTDDMTMTTRYVYTDIQAPANAKRPHQWTAARDMIEKDLSASIACSKGHN